jgi:hypothetical protein
MSLFLAVLVVTGLISSASFQHRHFIRGERRTSYESIPNQMRPLFLEVATDLSFSVPTSNLDSAITDAAAANPLPSPTTDATAAVNSPKPYIPRSDHAVTQGAGQTRTYTPRTVASEPREPRVYQGTGSKVYKPRVDPLKPVKPVSSSSGSSYSARPAGSNYGGGSANHRDDAMILAGPQLLIRYKVPRMKSEFKIQLEGLQETFRDQSEASR